MRVRILPYMKGSRGAKRLAEALGGKRFRLQNSRFLRRPSDVIINWGNSRDEREPTHGNDKTYIKLASNKLNFFKHMESKQVSCLPPFWTNPASIPEDAYPVVCRTILSGHSGAGIVIAESPDTLVPAPLYVKYLKKKDEYRVHCGVKDGIVSVIAVQRKARSHSVPIEKVNWAVRNHANGFVYVRQGVQPPDCVIEAAVDVMGHSGLLFGAVDVIYNEKLDKAFVLEINTAPGMEGQTVIDYANFFKEKIYG